MGLSADNCGQVGYTTGESSDKEAVSMANNEESSKTRRAEAKRDRRKSASPLSPGYDKKLDGPNRPST